MHRVNHQYQQRARYSANPRSEERNDIGHADNHTYQNCIWSTDNTRTDKTYNADNNGIDNLSAYKSDKCTMDKSKIRYYFVAGFTVK